MRPHRKALELVADVDEQRRAPFALPEDDGDEAAGFWKWGVAREWAAELADEREDIYTLADGEPVQAKR